MNRAAEQVVEHAEAQRAADGIDPRDVELGDRRRHDREVPPASTGARSGLSAASARRSTCPQPIIRLRSRARPSGVMPPAESPFCSRISASASAVPDDANASFQCSRPNSAGDPLDLGARTVSAAANASARQPTVAKKRCVMPTQPIFSDSSRCGVVAAADDEFGRAAADVDRRGAARPTRGSTWATPL